MKPKELDQFINQTLELLRTQMGTRPLDNQNLKNRINQLTNDQEIREKVELLAQSLETERKHHLETENSSIYVLLTSNKPPRETSPYPLNNVLEEIGLYIREANARQNIEFDLPQAETCGILSARAAKLIGRRLSKL